VSFMQPVEFEAAVPSMTSRTPNTAMRLESPGPNRVD
jgi:hypothetical protein